MQDIPEGVRVGTRYPLYAHPDGYWLPGEVGWVVQTQAEWQNARTRSQGFAVNVRVRVPGTGWDAWVPEEELHLVYDVPKF